MATKLNEVYQVCVFHTHRDYFDYRALGCEPQVGARVWVPFRNQRRLGIVIGSQFVEQPSLKLKCIDELLDDAPLISSALMNLSQWVGSYYQAPLSEVLPLFLPKKYRQGEPVSLPVTDCYQLLLAPDKAHALIRKGALKQHALVDFLKQFEHPVPKPLLRAEGYSAAQIQSLLDLNLIEVSEQTDLPYAIKPELTGPLSLNPEQAEAVHAISQQLHHYRCFLLQGVTGSGKTEVYLQVIASVLAQGKQVLVLVPEIGLTPQLLARFRNRFPQPIAVIHSSLNDSERQKAWQLAKDQLVKLVIGTRTAVFTPMPGLGLIVIDEEHDSSLKQMEKVRYSARDTALVRAHSADIPVILGSATPSLESLHNCHQGKYQRLFLNQKAMTSTPLYYRLIDIRSQALQQGLASQTLEQIKTHLQAENQVLVFINRRGFSPVLLCHQCGWMADCRACDAHLTLHRENGRLICHHCGLVQRVPQNCQSCQSAELIPVGVGTQRIHEFLSGYFPDHSVLRIDRDEVRKKNAFDERLELINSGQAQLIVGTQMLAKGHHFPRLSLVVILDADAGLYNQDFRAIERLGQLLTQVAGRAGRAEVAGEVVIQTHQPQHPLLNCLIQEGYDAFAQHLLLSRQQGELPPYHHLAVIRAQSKQAKNVLSFLHSAKDRIQAPFVSVLGPAPAPLYRKSNQHRMQLLVKSPSRSALGTTLAGLREWLAVNSAKQDLRWNVDVDPLDLS